MQTQEHLYKILFVRFNNFDNSLYSTSRNATVFNYNADNLESDTNGYNTSVFWENNNSMSRASPLDKERTLFATA